MSEEKSLYVIKDKTITPSIWNMIREMAPVIHQSRMFGVTSVEQGMAIMLKGYEIGIGFTASFELIQVVQGKPALSPRGALALLHSAPEIKTVKITRLVDSSGKFVGYECFMERNNGFSYTARWTMEDAKRAGLIKPDSGWASYPENMCMWRAIGFAADVVAPDITAGLTLTMKAPEMFGAGIDDNGNLVIDGVSPTAPSKTVVPDPPAAPMMTLDQLVDLFGVDAVLTANDGLMPMSDSQVNTVAMKLAGVAQLAS
jgi:hypothetical protein